MSRRNASIMYPLNERGVSVGDFPRLAIETDDAPRIQRAINSLTSGIVIFPAGTYTVKSQTITVSAGISLDGIGETGADGAGYYGNVTIDGSGLPANAHLFTVGGTSKSGVVSFKNLLIKGPSATGTGNVWQVQNLGSIKIDNVIVNGAVNDALHFVGSVERLYLTNSRIYGTTQTAGHGIWAGLDASNYQTLDGIFADNVDIGTFLYGLYYNVKGAVNSALPLVLSRFTCSSTGNEAWYINGKTDIQAELSWAENGGQQSTTVGDASILNCTWVRLENCYFGGGGTSAVPSLLLDGNNRVIIDGALMDNTRNNANAGALTINGGEQQTITGGTFNSGNGLGVSINDSTDNVAHTTQTNIVGASINAANACIYLATANATALNITDNNLYTGTSGQYFSGLSRLDSSSVVDRNTHSGGGLNRTNGTVQWGSAAPTTGSWLVGDVIYNNAPAASGNIGWVCVTAGTPGTWKTFGTISA